MGRQVRSQINRVVLGLGRRVCFVAALVCLGMATPAGADTALDWNQHAATAIAPNFGGSRAFIRLAMVHLAVYNAVNAIDGFPFGSYYVAPTVTYPASRDAATAAAAHAVLVALLPALQADLEIKLAASLAVIPDGPAKQNGIAAGVESAAQVWALRAGDGRDDVVPYTPGSGPGVWVPTPPAFAVAASPEVAYVRPFTLRDPWQFRSEPPPDLGSEAWARDYNAVKRLGVLVGSSRTVEQTDIGRFWTDNPFLQFNRAFRATSVARQLTLSENARFFAMVSAAMADAYIAAWDSKFFYGFWRPVTAIRAGDTDGRADTDADPAWTPLATTPTHPEYPAAHPVLSAAAAQTLKSFFDTDDVEFIVDSNVAGLLNPVRVFYRLSDMVAESQRARLYGGMHYPFSSHHGAILGRQVGTFLTQHFFGPSRP
jgi:hypothetical protein